MTIDFSKFDQAMDLEGLASDIQKVEENGGGDYKEVPYGTYEVKITKLELTESKKHDPMVTAWFKILNGEYKNSLLFMNQVVTQGFQIILSFISSALLALAMILHGLVTIVHSLKCCLIFMNQLTVFLSTLLNTEKRKDSVHLKSSMFLRYKYENLRPRVGN